MRGSTASVMRAGAKKFTAIVSSSSAVVSCCTRRRLGMAALCTITSRWPNSSHASSATCTAASTSPRSQGQSRWPSPAHRSTTSRRRSSRRATTPTVAPRSASMGASAAPIPDDAPVTSTVVPSVTCIRRRYLTPMSDSPVAAGADQAEPVSLGVRGRKVVMAVAFAVAAVAAQLLRQRGYRTWNTVWAEDGFVYAADAYRQPALSTLFRGYAGYAQFGPRLLILPARLLPVSALAAYCAIVSAAVWALLGLFVVRSSRGWIESRGLRVVLAVLVVAAPTAFYEVNANLANLGWPLLYAAAWAVASRRTGAADVAARV